MRSVDTSRCGGMADAADLNNLSARRGNSRVDGVKFGEPVFCQRSFASKNGNAELRPAIQRIAGKV